MFLLFPWSVFSKRCHKNLRKFFLEAINFSALFYQTAPIHQSADSYYILHYKPCHYLRKCNSTLGYVSYPTTKKSTVTIQSSPDKHRGLRYCYKIGGAVFARCTRRIGTPVSDQGERRTHLASTNDSFFWFN